MTIRAVCGTCHQTANYAFCIPTDRIESDKDAPVAVNPTDEPSRILDVGQWIVLFRVITEAAAKETDKVLARHLGIQAAQCLEEALKFYRELDNDLPPAESLFTEASRDRFRDAPEQFSRCRLIDLRAKLPTMAAMRASLSKKQGKRHWWRRRG